LSHVALITGVGPGLGGALARRFSREGYCVGLLARTTEFTSELAQELAGGGRRALPLMADVGEPAEVAEAVRLLRMEFGPISVMIHNASSSLGDGLLKTTPEEFEQSWRVAALGGFVCAKETAPNMLAAGAGVMLFTGATSSVRGGGWLAFSSAKFAMRGLAQSLARELWPLGIHVAHVVVDGSIATPGLPAEILDDAPAVPILNPGSMADAYWNLARQEKSAWTLEIDLRPHDEQFFV